MTLTILSLCVIMALVLYNAHMDWKFAKSVGCLIGWVAVGLLYCALVWAYPSLFLIVIPTLLYLTWTAKR